MPSQNGSVYGLTLLCPIIDDPKATPSHDLQIRDHLAQLNRRVGSESPFAVAPGTHMARWVVLDDVIYPGAPSCEEHLKSKYLVFESNCDGDRDSYLTGLAEAVPDELDAVWSHCVAYPGARDLERFLAYMRRCEIETTFYFAPVNDRTRDQTLVALRNKAAIAHFIAEHQGVAPEIVKKKLLALYARLQTLPAPVPAAVAVSRKMTTGGAMSKLNASDIQGFSLRGYNMPFARYIFLHLTDAKRTRGLLLKLLPMVTTGQLWDEKPKSTVNIAFTHKGLTALELPLATLISFPPEFQLGMKARGNILGDVGKNAHAHWDEVWKEERVHVWLAINALTQEDLAARVGELETLIAQSGGAAVVGYQDAASLQVNGEATTKEHFGYTDGFGNPDYVGVCRDTQPGQGKLMPDGTWAPLATGELLLGYADEAGELPVAPVPHLLASNGTFMVYRKLHQNVGTFRGFLEEWSKKYGGSKEKLAAKIIGRWRDGTPIELSPDRMDRVLVKDPMRNTDFLYGNDLNGTRCPIGAHVRRSNPRDAFGFEGALVHRRRISRRGLTYGPPAPPEHEAVDAEALDKDDRGIVFMALNASLSRQFEFVQQQWISYGNDAHLGNEKDLLMAEHGEGERFAIQGDTSARNPPLFCTRLPSFVELKGGAYFFIPSITALGMLAKNLVDPR